MKALVVPDDSALIRRRWTGVRTAVDRNCAAKRGAARCRNREGSILCCRIEPRVKFGSIREGCGGQLGCEGDESDFVVEACRHGSGSGHFGSSVECLDGKATRSGAGLLTYDLSLARNSEDRSRGIASNSPPPRNHGAFRLQRTRRRDLPRHREQSSVCITLSNFQSNLPAMNRHHGVADYELEW